MGKILNLFGLTTREELQAAIKRKNRWHRLVRDVFARYYVKFRESDLGHMPELPVKYSSEWEEEIRQEISEFHGLDLESVGEVLEACGFGTERWERLKDAGVAGLDTLIDEHISNLGTVSPERVEELLSEELLLLLQRRPHLLQQFAERFDEKSGRYNPTEDEMRESQAYLDLEQKINDAQMELRKFRSGGRRAVDQLKVYEKQIEALKSELFMRRKEETGDADAGLGGFPSLSDLGGSSEEDLSGLFAGGSGPGAGLEDRQIGSNGKTGDQDELRQLQSELKMREHTIGELQEKLEKLEFQMQSSQILDGVGFADSAGNGAGEVAEDSAEDNDADLQVELKKREHTIAELEEKVQQLELQLQSSNLLGAGDAEADVSDVLDDMEIRETAIPEVESEKTVEEAPAMSNIQYLNELRSKDHAISGLEDKVAKLEYQLQTSQMISADDVEVADDLDGQAEQVVQLKKTIHAREHAIENLREELGQQAELNNVAKELRTELKVKDHSIRDLKDQLEKFENQLGGAREKLLAEVNKLASLAEGDVQFKPSAELDGMDANELLDYAQDIAEDLDVRKQSLEEGIQGIDSVKSSYEESKQAFEAQQQEMEQQLEEMRTELENYAQNQEQKSDEDSGSSIEAGGEPKEGDEETENVIQTQRDQLQLLAGRMKDMIASNKSLQHANQNMYTELEAAMHKLMPLRRQIEDLQKNREALEQYIREKHDRTFTLKKLQRGDA